MTGLFRATLGVAFVLVMGCEAGLSIGGACSRSGECRAPFVCLLARCRSECVSQRDCPLGGRCVLGADGAGICALPDDPRCPEVPCAPSLLCVSSGACVNACDSVASCPAGSVCVLDESRRGYCERDDVDAGPGPDAGPADASELIDVADVSETPDAGCFGPGCDPIVDIALTTVSSCARTDGGAVYCWGFGDHIARPGLPTCPSSGTPCTGTPVRARVDDGGATGDLSASWLVGAEANYAAVVASRAFAWGAGYTNALGTVPSGEVARAVRLEPGTSFLPNAVGGVRLGAAFGIAVGPDASWMWGAEVTEVYAEIGDSLLHPGLGIDDAGLLSFRLSNGVYGTLDTSWSRPKSYPTWGDVKIEVLGERGLVRVDAFNQHVAVSSDKTGKTQWAGWGSNIDAGLVADFVGMIQEDRQPSITGYDGLKALEVALAAYESARAGRPVSISHG